MFVRVVLPGTVLLVPTTRVSEYKTPRETTQFGPLRARRRGNEKIRAAREQLTSREESTYIDTSGNEIFDACAPGPTDQNLPPISFFFLLRRQARTLRRSTMELARPLGVRQASTRSKQFDKETLAVTVILFSTG